MLYRIDGILIFLVTMYFSTAQNSDYVVSFSNSLDALLAVNNKPFSGKGLTFCSWMKIARNQSSLTYLKAKFQNTEIYRLSGNLKFKTSSLYAVTQVNENATFLTAAKDCNVKNSNSWVHLCIVSNQSSVFFYYNGFPVQNYVQRASFSTNRNTNLDFEFGNTDRFSVSGSMYQINVFDREITPNEAMKMHNCQAIDGDIVSWKDITSKKEEVIFYENMKLMKDQVPCPNPPKYQMINCTTGEPVPDQTDSGDPDSTSGNLDPGSTSGISSQDSGSGLSSEGSGSGVPSQGSGSGSPVPGSDLESQGTTSGNPSQGSSSGNPSQGSASGNSSPGSDLG